MSMKTSRTRFTGVYTRESTERRYNGKPDVVFYYCLKIDGKRVWTKCGWRSEGMTAQAAYQMRNEALAKRRGLPTQVPRISDAWEYYKTHHLLTLRNSKATISYMQKHILPEFGHMFMDDVTPAMVTRLKNARLASGMAPASVKHMLHVLSSLYTQTEKAGLGKCKNPVKDVTPPKVDNQRTRYLTHAEARMLLDALAKRAPVWHDIAALSLYTGGRLGEILSLTVSCIDLTAGVAEVNGKTGRRMLHLSAPAVDIMARLIKGKLPTDHIFPGKVNGHACVTHNVFNELTFKLGLNTPETPRAQRVVFHTLRHTFASWLAIDGVPLLVISQLMGHASITMTQRYAHLCPDSRQAAVALLATHFKSPDGDSD